MQNHNDYICFEYHNGCFFFKMSFRYDIYSHWLHLGGFSPKVRFKSVLKLVAWVDAKLQWLHLFGEHLVNPQLSLLVHHHLNDIHHPQPFLSPSASQAPTPTLHPAPSLPSWPQCCLHRNRVQQCTRPQWCLRQLPSTTSSRATPSQPAWQAVFVRHHPSQLPNQLDHPLGPRAWETSTAFSSRTWSILWSGECPKIWVGNLTVHGLKCKFSHSSGLSSFHPIASHNLGKLVQFCLKFKYRLYPV